MAEKIIKKTSLVLFIVMLVASIGLFFVFEPNNAAAQSASVLYYADSEIPVVQPRSVWDNSGELNAMISWLPQNEIYPSDWQPVERIVVHDTATYNEDTLSAIARIQSIFRFHAVTNGWGDIGYNYLIDREGKIYEGRLGGNGSRGAHAYNSKTSQNFNYGSIGISLLGEYRTEPIPAVMTESLSRLIGWLAATNNFDPAITQKTFSIWTPTTMSFSLNFTGPVVAGHKDIDTAKSDPGTLDFAAVRQAAAQYKQKYQGVIYQASGNSSIYQIISGERKTFNSLADFAAQGGTYSKIAFISQTQLDLFSSDRFLKYPDGSLLQASPSPFIFLMDGGKKRHLNITGAQFTKLGYDWASVKKVTTGDLSLYISGPDIIYGEDKSLIKDPQGKVYYIDNGRRRWVTSGQLFKALGYQWSKVQSKTQNYIDTILEGAVMMYPGGSLVKGSGSSVYLIENGLKREILSAQVFTKFGYKWNKIITISDEELARYLVGDFVGYKNGTLAKSGAEATVYLLSGGQKLAFISAEQFSNMGYKNQNVLTVSVGELEKYFSGGFVKYPDNTLVQQKGTPDVYRIESGQPILIPDVATFNKLKLSWAKVLKISEGDFDKLYPGLIQSPVSSAPSPTPIPTPTSAPTPSQPASQVQPNIRVAIWNVPSGQNSVVFSGSGAYDVYDRSGNLIAAKQAGEQYSINVSNPAAAFAKLVPKSGTILEIVSYQDLAPWKTGLNYNKFRGNLELAYSVKSSKLWVVNELALEEYLKGVAETNQGLNMEYLKTMSVAARTYALHYQQLGGKYGSDEVYHITNTTSDQLYKGYGREPYASDIVSSAQSTFGEVVYYNNSPIVTAYSSGAPELITIGSRAACSVWGGKYCQSGYEYLAGGVKDPQGTTYGYDSCGAGNHCVGLSGAGTRQLAAQGKTYKEILMYYYPGTTIQKIY
ncbi:MAG: hypothetical protein A2Y98_04015 [Candidatus Portnoybacteria bacterium RBG_19FT_COMBO_36_7]|uniref:Peptidoglycan recognition protein family domain-containing protein n=1 Tax=Candidatus Portnoybacteria bacterium RBG_19FT_COMBO_36_7 TaxID=1801992 RepID=A0A1G2F8S1_9BACT|nr:MAG: hypothetical protein A2Y98_04015 [Candidatus Portnoybacteria bacterium RBG_19FT_COMBO_36_7]